MTQGVQNIQNYNNRNNNVYAAQPAQVRHVQPVAVRLPDYYTEDKKSQSFKEALEDNPMYSTVIKGFIGALIDHPIPSLLTWFGCGFLLDKYTSACSGDYNKSLLKKVVNFGDNIQNSKFIQSKPVQKFIGLFKSTGKKGSKIIDKNSVLKAMRDTPSMPEWAIVKSEMISQRQRIVDDFKLIAEKLKLTEDGFAKLNRLAVNKSEKNLLKKFFGVNSISDIPAEKSSSFIQLKRLGKSDDFIKNALQMSDGGVSITKSEVLKAFGNKNKEWIKAIQEDTIGKYVGEVQEATKRVGNKVRISPGNYTLLGHDLGVLTTPTKRVVGCDNIYNRLYSLDGGAKTATGRFMSKFMQIVHRGITFGGGKLGVLLFIAPALVETAINVHKAEPSQKVGTGVSNLTNQISWVFTFPIALQIMHHICGAQYAGMSKEKVQELRQLQTDFNKKNKLPVEAGGFKDFAEYNAERKKVNGKMKALKKVKGQKWYTRFIRRIAGAVTPDLGKLDSYNTHNVVTRPLSKLRNLPRNAFGVPLRLLIFGGLTMGVLDAAINKSIKFIFGDSYDSMKDEEQKDAKKEQKKFLKEDLNNRMYEIQRQKVAAKKTQRKVSNNPRPQEVSLRGGAPYMQPTVLQKENIDNYTYIPSQENMIKAPQKNGSLDNYTYIPSQDSTIKTDKNGNSNSSTRRTYVPSQAAANINKIWDNSPLQSALDRADRAENRAYKVLSGDFEGI